MQGYQINTPRVYGLWRDTLKPAFSHHLNHSAKSLLTLLFPAVKSDIRQTDCNLVISGQKLLHRLHKGGQMSSRSDIYK